MAKERSRLRALAKTFRNFSQSLNNSAAGSSVGAEIEKLKETITKLGQIYPIDTTELDNLKRELAREKDLEKYMKMLTHH